MNRLLFGVLLATKPTKAHENKKMLHTQRVWLEKPTSQIEKEAKKGHKACSVVQMTKGGVVALYQLSRIDRIP